MISIGPLKETSLIPLPSKTGRIKLLGLPTENQLKSSQLAYILDIQGASRNQFQTYDRKGSLTPKQGNEPPDLAKEAQEKTRHNTWVIAEVINRIIKI